MVYTTLSNLPFYTHPFATKLVATTFGLISYEQYRELAVQEYPLERWFEDNLSWDDTVWSPDMYSIYRYRTHVHCLRTSETALRLKFAGSTVRRCAMMDSLGIDWIVFGPRRDIRLTDLAGSQWISPIIGGSDFVSEPLDPTPIESFTATCFDTAYLSPDSRYLVLKRND
jgi:hypothetical protein